MIRVISIMEIHRFLSNALVNVPVEDDVGGEAEEDQVGQQQHQLYTLEPPA